MDIFSNLFGGTAEGMFSGRGRGGRGNRAGPSRPQRLPVREVQLPVTLEDFYYGKKLQHPIKRQRPCTACEGRGTRSSHLREANCETCHGRGVRVLSRQIGPGMLQTMQTRCDVCHGQGRTIAEADRCTECRGEKLVEETGTLNVTIHPGMLPGTPISFPGEGSLIPEIPQAQDVTVILVPEQHERFKRIKQRQNDRFSAADLLTTVEIDLLTALTGRPFFIQHLTKPPSEDGTTAALERYLQVQPPAKKILRHGNGISIILHSAILSGEVLRISNEGMPVPGRGEDRARQRGALFVEIAVVFPQSGSLSGEQQSRLSDILPTGNLPSSKGPAIRARRSSQPKKPSPKSSPRDVRRASGKSLAGTSASNAKMATKPGSPKEDLGPRVEKVVLEEVDIGILQGSSASAEDGEGGVQCQQQ